MTQAILPILKAKDAGDIINIGSIAGREPYPGGSIYCASKAAVRSFTDAMRKELIATRIRVIEIDPGQVETEFSVVRFGGDREKAKKVYEGVEPLTGQDIAEVVVFAAGRRENVVLADTLVFPNHQVSVCGVGREVCGVNAVVLTMDRLLRRLCIGRRRNEALAGECRYDVVKCMNDEERWTGASPAHSLSSSQQKEQQNSLAHPSFTRDQPPPPAPKLHYIKKSKRTAIHPSLL